MICPHDTLPTLLLMSSVEILAPTLQFNKFEYLKGNSGRDVYYFIIIVVVDLVIGSRSIFLRGILVLVLVLFGSAVIATAVTTTAAAVGGVGSAI